jgi:hypothetical protein
MLSHIYAIDGSKVHVPCGFKKHGVYKCERSEETAT